MDTMMSQLSSRQRQDAYAFQEGFLNVKNVMGLAGRLQEELQQGKYVVEIEGQGSKDGIFRGLTFQQLNSHTKTYANGFHLAFSSLTAYLSLMIPLLPSEYGTTNFTFLKSDVLQIHLWTVEKFQRLDIWENLPPTPSQILIVKE